MTDLERHPGFAVTVSGSFKRHLSAIQEVVAAFQARGIVVLSPAEPTVVDHFGEFLFVSSDRRRSIKGIQNRHLSAIRHSNFLWLCCSDGYVGQSAAMEVGFATAAGVPIYADAPPSDLTLRQYCTVTGTIDTALALHGATTPLAEPRHLGLLVSPEATLARIHDELSMMEVSLIHDTTPTAGDSVEASAVRVRRLLALPAKK